MDALCRLGATAQGFSWAKTFSTSSASSPAVAFCRAGSMAVPLSTTGALAGKVAAETVNRAIKTANSVEGWSAYRHNKLKL
jgi:hypothetical protein